MVGELPLHSRSGRAVLRVCRAVGRHLDTLGSARLWHLLLVEDGPLTEGARAVPGYLLASQSLT